MTLRAPCRLFILAAVGLASQAAAAADKLAFAPPPSWVIPTERPRNSDAPTMAALDLVLLDQQIRLSAQSDDAYVETAARIQNPQGLQAMGTIAVAWNPDLDLVTIHKLQIIRGTRIIDVLSTGQTFTVLRRETNLEGAALDGTLTAELQPGGLQVGDLVDFSYTIKHTDPVFKGISEHRIGVDSSLPVGRLRIRAQWTSELPIRWQSSPAMAGLRSRAGISDSGFGFF